jgi:hypothetical protein
MKQRFVTEEIAGTGAIDVYMLDQPWVGQFIEGVHDDNEHECYPGEERSLG